VFQQPPPPPRRVSVAFEVEGSFSLEEFLFFFFLVGGLWAGVWWWLVFDVFLVFLWFGGGASVLALWSAWWGCGCLFFFECGFCICWAVLVGPLFVLLCVFFFFFFFLLRGG